MCIDIPIVNSKPIGSPSYKEFRQQGSSFLTTVHLVIILLQHVRYNKDWGHYEVVNPKHYGNALTSPMLYQLSHRRRNKKRKTCLSIHILLCRHNLVSLVYVYAVICRHSCIFQSRVLCRHNS